MPRLRLFNKLGVLKSSPFRERMLGGSESREGLLGNGCFVAFECKHASEPEETTE